MSQKSDSESSRKRSKSRSRQREQRSSKVYVTNLDGNARESDLESELKKVFSKYGQTKSLVVKKSRNAEYSFAFIEYQKSEEGADAVKNLDQTEIGGKKIKVEYQNDSRRRKDRNQGCYICHKFGHFARECREKRDSDRYRDERRRRSRSRSNKHEKKRRSRSRSHRKQKKKRSRSRSNDSRRRNDKHRRSRSRNRSNSSRS